MNNTERPGPRDYNRAARNTSAKESLDAWPRPLRWACLLYTSDAADDSTEV